MKIKINKQLNRPDGGVVPSGSIATSNPKMVSAKVPTANDAGTVLFPIVLAFDQASLDADKVGVPAITEFSYRGINKTCTQAEWDAMNDNADAGALVNGWMQTAIEQIIGVGNTEILI